jgi:2-methylcitrate dehydratase PrpD
VAKGQQKSNREVRKPKKSASQKAAAAGPATVTSTFAAPAHKGGKK